VALVARRLKAISRGKRQQRTHGPERVKRDFFLLARMFQKSVSLKLSSFEEVIDLLFCFSLVCVYLCFGADRDVSPDEGRASSIVPRRLESVALEHRKDGGGRRRNSLPLPRRPVAVSVAMTVIRESIFPARVVGRGCVDGEHCSPSLRRLRGGAGRLAVKVAQRVRPGVVAGNRPLRQKVLSGGSFCISFEFCLLF